VSASDDRERLIEIGLDVCAHRGYQKTTLADVAAAGGVLADVAVADKYGKFDPATMRDALTECATASHARSASSLGAERRMGNLGSCCWPR
jgi:hypothetical protein